MTFSNAIPQSTMDHLGGFISTCCKRCGMPLPQEVKPGGFCNEECAKEWQDNEDDWERLLP